EGTSSAHWLIARSRPRFGAGPGLSPTRRLDADLIPDGTTVVGGADQRGSSHTALGRENLNVDAADDRRAARAGAEPSPAGRCPAGGARAGRRCSCGRYSTG